MSTRPAARTDAAATQATISGRPAGDGLHLEVRSLAGAKMSEPFTSRPGAGRPRPVTTRPALTASPAPTPPGRRRLDDSVTLDQRPGADIYYTTDGTRRSAATSRPTRPSSTPARSRSAELTELNAVAFDAAGNYDTGQGFYTRRKHRAGG